MLRRNTEQPQSVGIAGDGDDVELLEDFEAQFGIVFTDQEAETLETLGQAHAMICAKLQDVSRNGAKCMTAMAYYRLNRAMRDQGKWAVSRAIHVPEGKTPRQFREELERKTGMRLSFLTAGSNWLIGLLILPFVSAYAVVALLPPIVAVPLAVLVFFLAFKIFELADRYHQENWVFEGTLGDLAKTSADWNMGFLVARGARHFEEDVWTAMTSTIHAHTGFPTVEMNPALRFI